MRKVDKETLTAMTIQLDSRDIPASDTTQRECGCLMHSLCLGCKTKPCKYQVDGVVLAPSEQVHGYQLIIPCDTDRVLWIENELLHPTMALANVQAQLDLLASDQVAELRTIILAHRSNGRLRRRCLVRLRLRLS